MATGFPTPNVTVVDPGLPDAVIGLPYSYFLTAMDGDPPFTWAIIGGSLPTGLALDTGTGEVSGTPTAVGEFNVEVEVTDSLAKTGTLILPIRSVPNLGAVRRYQQETILREGTSVIPAEGAVANEMRRRLAKLLVRTFAQVQNPYQLDARDLQVENFNTIALQSVDDALRDLLALISGAAYGLDDGSGAPFVTPGPDGELEVLGIGSIDVVKNIPQNRLEISFTGAPLASPYDMLPAPSGDNTGVTDTANLNAFLATNPQQWLVSPQDVGDDPYYINADVGSPTGELHRVTGKMRSAFRVIGVGGLRTINQVQTIENGILTDVRCRPNTTLTVTDHVNMGIVISVGQAYAVLGHQARFRDCSIELAAPGAALSMLHSGLVMHNCQVFAIVPDPLVFVTPDDTSGHVSMTRISECTFHTIDPNQLVLDFEDLDEPNHVVLLGPNFYVGPGEAIERPTSNSAENYAESVQLVDTVGTTIPPWPLF